MRAGPNVGACLLVGTLSIAYAASAGVYDRDPAHIWNRLHEALFVREFHGRDLGRDELDPLLWTDSRYLLVEPRHQTVLSALDEFSRSGAQSIPDPLRRAVLQHDLWAIFDWTAEGSNEPAQRRALAARLASAIRSLALPADRIRSLAPNYADAVSSNEFNEEYDRHHPRTPFLPPDLFEEEGSWVQLSAFGGELMAPAHAAGFSHRSAFLVFIRLPGGRAATLNYLNQLRSFPDYWRLSSGPGDDAVPSVELGPRVPQFPPGTAVALVRQMILIDDQGTLVPSKLTEDVQLRVYGGFGTDAASGPPLQDAFEFRMRRARLFASQGGGLQAVGPNEAELPVFSTHGVDMIDRNEGSEGTILTSILASCAQCHAPGGIRSVLSFGRRKVIPNARDEAVATIDGKRSSYSWGLLKGLWGN